MSTKVANTVTDENVQDIIDTASYGGITYWATQPTQAEFEALPKGKEFTIVEGVEDPPFLGGERTVEAVHYLSKDDIREAYSKLLSLDQKFVNREIHGYIIDSHRDRDADGIDCGHIDATAADVIVQIACFGEVIYG
uniref:Tail terminator n=1 Tax=Streptomyces phage Kamino TaxID=3158857 RepID=A0AAU7GYW2_9CAUD